MLHEIYLIVNKNTEYLFVFQVPYEILNKKFRLAQKNIDREVSHVQNATNDLDKCLQRTTTVGEVTNVLNGMVEKLSLLKRKVRNV